MKAVMGIDPGPEQTAYFVLNADEHFGIHGREFDLTFKDVISTKQTKGSLEPIPRKYLK